MALNAAQQKEMDALKEKMAAIEKEVRQSPALFSRYGSFFFEMFKDLNAQIEKLEEA